ncbi:MAG: hypothetical protein K2W95_21825 [Candidatus Obscuribacterales bacterium]|nr:hypothetical protein [Candidatus Obscuribacterales bacterium]
MTNEAKPVVQEAALKSSEEAVREAVAEFGAQHPEVLRRLERYVVMLRRAGRDAQADKLAEKAKTLRQILGPQADTPVPIPSAAAAPKPEAAPSTSTPPAEQSPAADAAAPVEKALFNSKGEHIAMETGGHLYAPSGKYLGYWSADMEAYISKEGRYLGQIVEDNRLGADPTWRFRHLSFTKGYEGDRAGWNRVADVNRVFLPYGFEDVEI